MTESTKSQFVTALHFVRGACAISVTAYHFVSWQYGVQYRSVGTFGVYTFFILSAVVLLHVHSKDFTNSISRADLWSFYQKRFARIVPLLSVTAVVYLLYYHLRYDFELWGLLQKSFLTGTGLFALHIPGYLSTTTGAWSLAIELWFYLLYPVVALMAASVSFRVLLLAFAGLVVSQQTLLSTLPESNDPLFWQQYTMPLTFAPFFAAGFLIFRAKQGAATQRNFWFSILCLGLVFSFSFITDTNVYEAGFAHICLMTGSIGAVWFAFNSLTPGRIGAAAKWAGNISYSLYLTHWLSFELAKDLAPNRTLPVVFAVVAFVIAHLSWRYIEKPLEGALRRTTPRHGVAPA